MPCSTATSSGQAVYARARRATTAAAKAPVACRSIDAAAPAKVETGLTGVVLDGL